MGSGTYHRIGGLIFLMIAGGAGWWGFWRPLQEAAFQDPEVHFGPRLFVLVPFAAVYGLFFLLFGDSVPYRNVEKQNFTGAGWLLLLVAAAASGAGYWWFESQLAALGYGN